MGSAPRAFFRLLAYFAWTVVLVPIQVWALAFDAPLARNLPVFYHRVCLRLLGFEVVAIGAIASPHPVLFVANHSSYFDITVLGSLIPGSFIAKQEVARWPVFGLLAKLQRTVFVDRDARHRVHHQHGEIAGRLTRRDNLVLFPEGTSDDGVRVLPFKTALLAAAEEQVGGRFPLVQPVSIAYTRLDGMPMGRALRPFFAWYGHMELAPHLWRALRLGVATVEVEFHAPVTIAEFASRKELALYCRTRIAGGIAAALAGRPAGLAAPETGAEPQESAVSTVPGRP